MSKTDKELLDKEKNIVMPVAKTKTIFVRKVNYEDKAVINKDMPKEGIKKHTRKIIEKRGVNDRVKKIKKSYAG
tara:strand:+ start:170 stop:391 length:222 start_codon:yes stop_codon:yes gene_type:complete